MPLAEPKLKSYDCTPTIIFPEIKQILEQLESLLSSNETMLPYESSQPGSLRDQYRQFIREFGHTDHLVNRALQYVDEHVLALEG